MSNVEKMTKDFVIARLKLLLEVPGAETPWDDIAAQLHELPLRVLGGLRYRVETARAASYDEGRVAGAATGKAEP